MKILFVLGGSNPSPTASWTRLGFFANAWSNKGHIVEVLGTFSYKSFKKRGVKKFNKVTIFNIIFKFGLIYPTFFALNSILSFIITTLFLVIRKPKVVIVSVPPGDIGFGAIMACKLVKAKFILDYRDEWEEYAIKLVNSGIGKVFYSFMKKLMASLYAQSQLVTVVTRNFMESLRLSGKVNVQLVPNGADVSVFKQHNKKIVRRKLRLDDADFIIVYSGGIGGYYKLERVVRVLAKLQDLIKDIKLIMIGQGPDLPFILMLSKKLGLHNKVLYLGVKHDRNEIAEILSAGDIGIIPGIYSKGQLPAKFFEYCACGLPVMAIVDNDSILAKLIKKYEIGLIAPPKNGDSLTEAIYWLYTNKSFRVEAEKRGRLLIEDKFNRSRIAEDFLNLVDVI